MKLEYNGTILECDIFDADTAEKFTEHTEKIIEVSKAVKTEKNLGKAIRRQCKAIFDFIDALFGEGTHNKLFGDSVNLRTCAELYSQINTEILKDKEQIILDLK